MNKSQKSEIRCQRSEKKWLLFFIVCILSSVSCVLNFAHADKIYIDITSPGIKRLPIAVQGFIGGSEISDIVKNDLTFTGLFDCIDESAHIERPEQPFNTNNWKGLGVEIVVKGKIIKNNPLSVIVSVYDVAENRELLTKEYAGSPDILRLISHSIANDIYKILTGQHGIFKTKIAFVGERNGTKELYLMDWDGYRIYSLGVTGGILLSPRWSYDKTKIIYSAERNRSWDIYLLDMNTLKEKNIVRLNGLNMVGNFFPNNKEFVFSSSKDGKSNIHVGDISSMKGWKLISSPWIDVSPAVSPDGNYILFVSNRSGSPQIYISDKEGNGIRRLTFEGSYNTSPAWSPKGDRIAFVRMINGKNQIFIMKPDGSGIMQLTTSGNNEDPCFSPDGRYITFTSDRDGSKGIYLMRSNGEAQKRITQKGIKATSPSWSP
ncbi:protein TolB [Dissulfurispira thermophila]|uniref:Protein TolB n=1 Tax=Dissulfurispira thermophila TaxID=2715679 RepID=A0A7G1GYJ0_9BACT|nr:Tol-Pal system beta propeller repeat protein TolB [Dissulfurispira thermophila]BCB95122.1 protein TolB [Dissulfurispira thermophila]